MNFTSVTAENAKTVVHFLHILLRLRGKYKQIIRKSIKFYWLVRVQRIIVWEFSNEVRAKVTFAH